MAEERVQRRLAAILAADVAGYSRLMGDGRALSLSALATALAIMGNERGAKRAVAPALDIASTLARSCDDGLGVATQTGRQALKGPPLFEIWS